MIHAFFVTGIAMWIMASGHISSGNTSQPQKTTNQRSGLTPSAMFWNLSKCRLRMFDFLAAVTRTVSTMRHQIQPGSVKAVTVVIKVQKAFVGPPLHHVTMNAEKPVLAP